jgi:hypothetical protein
MNDVERKREMSDGNPALVFYAFDGDNWSKHATLADASASAEESINIARDYCDPKWPDSVERVAVFEAPDGCEEPDEDGTLILQSRMVKICDAEPGDGVDFWCDYALAPVTPDPPRPIV